MDRPGLASGRWSCVPDVASIAAPVMTLAIHGQPPNHLRPSGERRDLGPTPHDAWWTPILFAALGQWNGWIADAPFAARWPIPDASCNYRGELLRVIAQMGLGTVSSQTPVEHGSWR